MTDTDRRRQRIEAQIAYEDARANLAGLILQLKAIGRRGAKIVTIIGDVNVDTDSPLQSEASLLTIAEAEYEGFGFNHVRSLGNAIVLARKELTEAQALARAMGCNV